MRESPEIHAVLKDLRAGDEAILTKLVSKTKGGKLSTVYDVQIVGKNGNGSDGGSTMPNQNTPNREDNFYYDAMEKSLEEASRLTNRYSGISISQIGISIFIQRTKNNGLTN